MAMMNGARIGIASQSIGIGEAAYRIARGYAHDRKQFGQRIEEFPAVRELLVDMRLFLDSARALNYATARNVDREEGVNRHLYLRTPDDKDLVRELKNQSRSLKRLTAMLTPMAKYFCSEMCVKVTSDALQVLGGSGYMKDYPVERLYRDARITTIYEGTSQLQLVAAVRGVTGGTGEKLLAEHAERTPEGVNGDVVEMLKEGRELVGEIISHVKQKPGTEYIDLYARKIVDAVLDVYLGYLFLQDAPYSEVKAAAAERWAVQRLPQVRMYRDQIKSDDRSVITGFEVLAGPPEHGEE
jgi:hypothetical protein